MARVTTPSTALTYPELVTLVKTMAQDMDSLKKEMRRLKAITRSLGSPSDDSFDVAFPTLDVADLQRFLKSSFSAMIESYKPVWPVTRKSDIPSVLSNLKQQLVALLNANLFDVLGILSDTEDEKALYPKTILKIMNVDSAEFEKALRKNKFLI
jgi:hypothetical protein